MCQGHSNPEIARELGLSRATVGTYVERLAKKIRPRTGSTSPRWLAAFAFQLGVAEGEHRARHTPPRSDTRRGGGGHADARTRSSGPRHPGV